MLPLHGRLLPRFTAAAAALLAVSLPCGTNALDVKPSAAKTVTGAALREGIDGLRYAGLIVADRLGFLAELKAADEGAGLTAAEVAAKVGTKDVPTAQVLLGLLQQQGLARAENRSTPQKVAPLTWHLGARAKSMLQLVGEIKVERIVDPSWVRYDSGVRDLWLMAVGWQSAFDKTGTHWDARKHMDMFAQFSKDQAQLVSQTLRLGDGERLLDVAGGSGVFCASIAKQQKQAKCGIADLPGNAAILRDPDSGFIPEGVRRRVSVHDFNMFDASNWTSLTTQFNYSVHFYSNIWHDWSLEENEELARHSWRSLPRGGHIVVFEVLFDDEELTGPEAATLYSLSMVHFQDARQYSEGEISHVLQKTGFVDVRCVRLPGFSNFSYVIGKKPVDAGEEPIGGVGVCSSSDEASCTASKDVAAETPTSTRPLNPAAPTLWEKNFDFLPWSLAYSFPRLAHHEWSWKQYPAASVQRRETDLLKDSEEPGGRLVCLPPEDVDPSGKARKLRIQSINSFPRIAVSDMTFYAGDTRHPMQLKAQGAGGTELQRSLTWRGRRMRLGHQDMAALSMLLQELRPKTVLDVGSGEGGAAVWMRDQGRALDLNLAVHSFDTWPAPPDAETPGAGAAGSPGGPVSFQALDELQPQTSCPRKWLDELPRPLLITVNLESIHVVHPLSEYLLQALAEGDYLVMFRAGLEGNRRMQWIRLLRKMCPEGIHLDTKYTDFFGLNMNGAPDGWVTRHGGR